MKLRMDLHTHVNEAFHLAPVTPEFVEKLVTLIKARGLDGIAITEHHNQKYAYKVKELVDQYFKDEVMIIPGWEINVRLEHKVELFLPGDRVFSFMSHPGYGGWGWEDNLDGVQGLEIDNGEHAWHMDDKSKARIREVAQERDLLLLTNSDAHSPDRIGCFSNEIDLDDLIALARPIT